MIGIGKKLYDEAQKPHNRRKIQDAMDKVQGKGKGKRRPQ